jgi:hypothetical protein
MTTRYGVFFSTSQGALLGGPLRVGVSILADLRLGSTPRRELMESYNISSLMALRMSPDVSACRLIVCA